MTTRTLLGTVSDRTEAVFGALELAGMRGDPDKYYQVWCKEWFRQADLFLEELKSEGLTKTYESLKQSVENQAV
jgi:hypothetical protein